MQTAPSFADRTARFSLRLLLGIHLLFLLALLFGIALATGRAKAEETIACSGKDLVAEMRRDAPEKLKSTEAEAAKIPNAEGIFWRIDKPGLQPSWLLGTMHVSDPRVTSLSPQTAKAFESAGTLVIEATDVLDQQKFIATVLAEPGLSMWTDDTTLTSLLSKEDAAIVEEGLKDYGIPLFSVSKMKPWMLTTSLAVPACELSRQAKGMLALDHKLAFEARNAGKPVEGLETGLGQLRLLASLPMEAHLQSLVAALRYRDHAPDIFETMIDLYESGNIALLDPFVRARFPEAVSGIMEQDFAATMIDRRNHTMADGAVPFIEQGNAFVAVGAVHLPGEKGLIELLKYKGYEVSRVE